MLEDEAIDALDSLKDMLKNEKDSLLEQQRLEAIESERLQKEFYTNTISEINNLSDIRGVNIPEKDRRELIDYIFKIDNDGYTKYQKDYQKSVKNLIESAYFTMKGDTLLSNAKKSGESNAIKKLKSSLASKSINKSSGKQSYEQDDVFTILSGQLRNKN